MYKEQVRQQALQKGFDGFELEDHSWGNRIDDSRQFAVFCSNHVKSVIGNNGDFDINNPSIIC